MSEARVPTSVVVSLSLHAGGLVLFGLMMREGPKQAAKMVEGVDLIVNAPKARAAALPAPKAKPLSTMDFLKLALPSAPRAAAPAQLDIKIPEHKIALAQPKLEDRAHRDLPKLQALDLSNHPVDSAKLDVKVESRRQAAATLAALPRLEDVGRRRIKNLPQAMALEESRREAVAAQGLPDMALKTAPSRRQAMAAVAALQEAAPAPESGRSGLGSLLPQKPLLMEARPQAMAAPKIDKVVPDAPKLQRRQAAQADVQKKGVEIEGPLADRRVVASAIPAFPDWAKSQGILEANVSIRFTVDEDGNVMPDMRLTASSGYGRLDKLTMDALRSWRFASKPGAGIQWGVITFRYLVE